MYLQDDSGKVCAAKENEGGKAAEEVRIRELEDGVQQHSLEWISLCACVFCVVCVCVRARALVYKSACLWRVRLHVCTRGYTDKL